jgi:hypothetical protein
MPHDIRTITLEPWASASTGVRVACQMGLFTLWPLSDDDRMTVLISLLSYQIDQTIQNEDQIEAILDMIRMHLKLKLTESPPLQANE